MKVLSILSLFLSLLSVTYALAPSLELKTKPCDTSIEDCIKYYFPENYTTAKAIFRAESSLNPTAKHKNTNGTIDCGIGQINFKGTVCPEGFMDVEINLAYARWMYDRRGWQPWVVYNNKSYLRYIE